MAPTTGVLAQSSGDFEEILVLARKKEEKLQDVAISVSAATQQEIERRFVQDIRDMVDISPNLVIDDTAQGPGGVAAVYIRGVGVADVESNFDPAVATVIDGVYHGKLSGGLHKTFDVERMEVLRGPQGTLFGRNAIGGVIQLNRTKPTGELGGKLRVGAGDYDTTYADGIFNFGNEEVGIKLFGSYRNQDEGYFDNLINGGEDGEIEYYQVGARILWNATDRLSLDFTYDIERTDQDTPPLNYVGQPGQVYCDSADASGTEFGYCAPNTDDPLGGDRYDVTQQGRNDADFEVDTYILQGNFEWTDNMSVDAIIGYRDINENVFQDFDATPEILFETNRPEQYDQTSVELRLNRQEENLPLSYTVGAYWWDSEYEIQLESFIGFGFDVPTLSFFRLPAPVTVPRTSKQTTDSYALFFEGDWDFNDQWTLTAGLRWTKDDKTTRHTGVPTIDTQHENWDEFTPKLALRYTFNDEAMAYLSYVRGYRSGGFVGRPDEAAVAIDPYDPETLDNFELGAKTEWFDRTLTLNGAIFVSLYDDKQEEVSESVPLGAGGTGQQTVIANAAEATVWGVELEALWYPIDGLTLRANLGYLDAEYDDFDADLTGDGVITDNSDLEFRRAPEWTGALNAEYEWQLGPGNAWVRAGYHYIDEHEMTLLNSPQTSNDSQHLVDGSVNYGLENWTFSVYGRNLTDEDGYGIGFDVATLWTYAAPRAPRTWGAEVVYSF
ncbi:MAG: TonB-dependent receptor [Chromatiales bacterium]|nr:MAG: TonB-dependent receptor [Chromatiales bacterium]